MLQKEVNMTVAYRGLGSYSFQYFMSFF